MKDNVKGNRQIFLATLQTLKFSSNDYTEVARLVSESASLHALEWACYHYPEQGGTYIWFLGESHIAMDHYPEYNLIEITLVSCKEFDIAPVIKQIMDLGFIIQNYSIIDKNKDHQWQSRKQ